MTVALSIAIFATTYENDQVAEVETLVLRPTVIADRSLGSRNGNPVGGRRLVSGRWFLRFSKDTNGSITLRSISTSGWK